jgi:hypothetical protein
MENDTETVPAVSEIRAINLAISMHLKRYHEEEQVRAAARHHCIYDVWFVEIIGTRGTTGYTVWQDESGERADCISDGAVHMENHSAIAAAISPLK